LWVIEDQGFDIDLDSYFKQAKDIYDSIPGDKPFLVWDNLPKEGPFGDEDEDNEEKVVKSLED